MAIDLLPAVRRRTLSAAARPASNRVRTERMALAVPPVVAALGTFLWFPLGRFMAAGDVTPFIRDGTASELTSFWNHRINGAGAATPVIAQAPEVLVLRLVGALGLPEYVAQQIFYAAIFALAAFGAAYLVRAFVDNAFVVVGAGLLAVYNPFVLVRMPNPLPMLWIGLIATATGLVIRAARGAPGRGLAFAVVCLSASYLSINPPLLGMAVLTMIAVVAGCSWIVGPGGTRRAARFVMRSSPWVVAINLWWLVPLALGTIAREGVNIAAQTRVEDWSWSHGMNTIPNVVSLTADWGWTHPEYLPFASSLDAMPWTLLRWILPGLALAAPLLTKGRRRKAVLVLLGAGVVFTFLGKGLHEPLASWNLWLYHHVPGMWLLREPVSKVGGALLLVEIVLAAMTLTAILSWANKLSMRRGGALAALATVAVLLALAFPYPLWAGGTGSDGTRGLPKDEVTLPEGWRRLAHTVDAAPESGRVLVLPLNRYYQVTTRWGYHGADELPMDLMKRPVLALLPDGYFSPSGDLSTMMRAAQKAIVEGDADRARTLLRLLGVSHVVVRNDLAARQVQRPVVASPVLEAGLGRVADVTKPERFGVADLYTVDGGAPLAWSPRQVVGLTRRDGTQRVEALADLPDDTASVTPGAVPIDRLSWEAPDALSSGVRFDLRSSGKYEVGLIDQRPVDWRARVREDAASPALEFVDPVSVNLNGEALPGAAPMSVPLTEPNVSAIDVDGRLGIIRSGDTMVRITSPGVVRAFAQSAVSVRGPAHAADWCGPHKSNDPKPTVRNASGGFDLHSSGGIACTTVPGPALSPDGVYRVHVRLRSADGATGHAMCLWQGGGNRCTPLVDPKITRTWSTFDVAVRTDPDITGLVLYLYASASDHSTATVQYRDLRITPMREVGRGPIVPGVRPPATRQLDKGSHEMGVTHPPGELVLRPDSPLGDCHAVDDRTPADVGLAVHPIPQGVQLEAEAHSACVHAAVPGAVPGSTYTLSLDVRTLSGYRARLCVWQEGPNRCARQHKDVPGSSSWAPYRTRFTLDKGTTSTRLYLYADGNGAVPSVTQYRNIRLRAVAPDVIEVRPHRATPRPVPIAWRETGPGSVAVEPRTPVEADQLVVVNESFAGGWSVSGTDPSAHVRANGYANAWLVPPRTGAFDVRYGRSGLMSTALVVSLFAGAAAILATLVRRRRAQRDTVFLGPTGELVFRPQSAPSRWLGRVLALRSSSSRRRISWRPDEE